MAKRYRRYKNIIEKFLDSDKGQRWFNVVYSVGAAIVILGAMFKLLHLPYGNTMLMVGMITEALVFLLSALDKPHKEYKWEDVFPALIDKENTIINEEQEIINDQKAQPLVSPNVDERIKSNSTGRNHDTNNSQIENSYNSRESRNFSQNQYSSSNNESVNYSGNFYGHNIPNHENTQTRSYTGVVNNDNETKANNTSSINNNSTVYENQNVAQASERYATQLNMMSDNMTKFAEVTNSLGNISETLVNSFSKIIDNSQGIGDNTQGYIEQLNYLNKNIAGLNTIYEIQLKGVSGQINTIEEINAGLDRMKKLYSGSLADSSLFKNESEKMAKQLVELNNVYARLLQAMTSNSGGNMNNGNINSNPSSTNL